MRKGILGSARIHPAVGKDGAVITDSNIWLSGLKTGFGSLCEDVKIGQHVGLSRLKSGNRFLGPSLLHGHRRARPGQIHIVHHCSRIGSSAVIGQILFRNGSISQLCVKNAKVR